MHVQERSQQLRRQSDGWVFSFRVEMRPGFGRDQLCLELPDSMRAVAKVPSSASREIAIGIPPALQLAGNRSSLLVSRDGHQVRIRAPRSIDKRVEWSIDVPVEWTLPGHVPERVEIEWIIRSPTHSVTDRGRWTGYRPTGHAHQLVDFLMHPAGDAFLFSCAAGACTFEYSQLSPVVASALTLIEGNVWGTTWPSEAAFWTSSDGTAFLAQQFTATPGGERETSRRMAVIPEELDHADLVAFATEMEAQHRLGVDIRVFDWDDAKERLGLAEADAALRLGEAMAVTYEIDLSTNTTTSRVSFRRDQIALLEDIYQEVQPRGIAWATFVERLDGPTAAVVHAGSRRRVVAMRHVINDLRSSSNRPTAA